MLRLPVRAMTNDAISLWISQLKNADENAIEHLWNLYSKRLSSVARRNLRNRSASGNDSEDIAIIAFESFCRQAVEGKFPKLDDQTDLWRILLTIVIRNANRATRKRHAFTLSDAEFFENEFLSSEPRPELVAQFHEELNLLLGRLKSNEIRQTAIMKLEGYTNREIAQKLGRSLSFVERNLHRIRNECSGWRSKRSERLLREWREPVICSAPGVSTRMTSGVVKR